MQVHAGAGQAKDQKRRERQSEHQLHRGCDRVGDLTWLRRDPTVGGDWQRRHANAKRGYGGADAKDAEACESQLEVHEAVDGGGLVQAADEVHQQNVREHVRGRPLGHSLHDQNAPPRPSDALGATVPEVLAHGEHDQLEQRDHHRVDGHEDGAHHHIIRNQSPYQADHGLVVFAESLHPEHVGFRFKQVGEKAREQHRVAGQQHSDDPTPRRAVVETLLSGPVPHQPRVHCGAHSGGRHD
mmetsp:Transcript_39272/g.118711  ORF Transcript_39272/g.118711 Transcript_39272/m.118711 type:complete len:241 (+) Transcript_39272:2-724(+)